MRGQLRLFADDTKLFRDFQRREDCDALQADIDRLQKWSETWLLGFNAQKCKVMRLGKNPPEYLYKMGDVELEETLVEKDLGVMTDNRLRENRLSLLPAKQIKLSDSSVGPIPTWTRTMCCCSIKLW